MQGAIGPYARGTATGSITCSTRLSCPRAFASTQNMFHLSRVNACRSRLWSLYRIANLN